MERVIPEHDMDENVSYLHKLDFGELNKFSGYLANKYANSTLIISSTNRILYAGAAARQLLKADVTTSLEQIEGSIAKTLLQGAKKCRVSEAPYLLKNVDYIGEDQSRRLDVRFSLLNWSAIEEQLVEIELLPFSVDANAPKPDVSSLLSTQKLQEVLDENHFLDDFVIGAAHDLKGPLVVIRSYIELIKRFKDERRKEEALGIIKSASLKMESILKGLEDMVNFQQDQQEQIKELSLSATFESACQHLDYQIQEARPLLMTDFSGVTHIRYIKPYLFSILYNLLSNALKYRSHHRMLEITIKSRKEGEFVVLNFKDNGIGMDLQNFGHLLFEPFQRLCTEREGTGLGLCMINKMLSSNGGRIEVQSKPGEGTTFEVYLRSRD